VGISAATLERLLALELGDKLQAVIQIVIDSHKREVNPVRQAINRRYYLKSLTKTSENVLNGLNKTSEHENGKVFVKIGTPQWAAWEIEYRRSKGKTPPVDKLGIGWHFPSEWPPNGAGLASAEPRP